MTKIMIESSRHGEAQWTNLKGFSIAGKTGTAQIPIAGHYDAEKTIASFVGFAPAENPKFVMIVTLKEPQSSPWASETAKTALVFNCKRSFQNFWHSARKLGMRFSTCAMRFSTLCYEIQHLVL